MGASVDGRLLPECVHRHDVAAHASPAVPSRQRHSRPGVHDALTAMTILRVVALLQSLESSRHRMMYSLWAILLFTMASTALAATCRPLFFLPGAALIRPWGGWVGGWGRQAGGVRWQLRQLVSGVVIRHH